MILIGNLSKMKVRQLIQKLQDLENLHGNLNVIYMSDETMGCLSTVDTVSIENFVPSDWVIISDSNENLYKDKPQEKVIYINNDWFGI